MPCYGCVAVVCIHGSVAWYPELIPVIPLETSESENHRKIAETHFETSWKPRETTVNECVLPESLTWNYLKQLRSGLKSRFSATLTHFLFLGPWQIFGVFSLFLKNFCAIHWFSKWFLTVFYGFWVVSTGFKVVSKQFSVFSSVFHWFAKGLRVSALEYQLSHGGGGDRLQQVWNAWNVDSLQQLPARPAVYGECQDDREGSWTASGSRDYSYPFILYILSLHDETHVESWERISIQKNPQNSGGW